MRVVDRVQDLDRSDAHNESGSPRLKTPRVEPRNAKPLPSAPPSNRRRKEIQRQAKQETQSQDQKKKTKNHKAATGNL